MPLLYRARWSFAGETRSLMDTGRLMARWSEQVVDSLAPALPWSANVEEHADFDLIERWETSHVVRFEAGERGLAISRLRAGGRDKRVGGTGRLTVHTVGPVTFFEADGHCNVEHWDIRAAGVEPTALDAARVLLEGEVGAPAEVVVASHEEYARGPLEIARTADEDEARMWAGDLDDVGLVAALDPHDGGFSVRVTAHEITTLDALEEARVTIGEILAEAGHEDWSRRADELLARCG